MFVEKYLRIFKVLSLILTKFVHKNSCNAGATRKSQKTIDDISSKFCTGCLQINDFEKTGIKYIQ